jgi:hypothetical protein
MLTEVIGECKIGRALMDLEKRTELKQRLSSVGHI